MFNTTIETLKNNDINVIGLENDIVYAEKDGIRVAIIGINNVVIGSARDYIDAGMYIYDLGKLKNSILEARTKADTVIVMTHYGKENVHEITDVMRWFAREIVKAGADIVLGGHSLGIYPVEEYEGKLIIYSLGYLMHDTTKEIGKKSAIFDIDVSVDGKIQEVRILPTYIKNKNTVKLYKEINQKECDAFLKQLKDGSQLTNYTSNIVNDKLAITLNK
jgi:poly-gamma-glutamate synthesis protein (capsule biosynthesis protein)